MICLAIEPPKGQADKLKMEFTQGKSIKHDEINSSSKAGNLGIVNF